MYPELYQYLLHYKKLTLPGIGSFFIERKPATGDFPNKLTLPPGYEVVFEPVIQPTPRFFFSWLGSISGITEREAVVRFNDFVYNLRQQISNGDVIHWNGVGVLSKGLTDDIKFSPQPYLLEKPVKAEKVLREKAGHMVRVGEEEKTSVEMTALLNQPVQKRKQRWLLVSITAVVAILFIVWYLSIKGVGLTSISNTKKLVPLEATSPSRTLP